MKVSEIKKEMKESSIVVGPMKICLVEKSGYDIARVIIGVLKKDFLIEISSRWTPKSLMDSTYRVKAAACDLKLEPLLVVPYLSEDSFKMLENVGVNGVDLCGNAFIRSEGFYFYVSGRVNRFKASAPIKNIYRNNTSSVARICMTVPKFSSITEIISEISKRTVFGSVPTLPTVSKAVKSLEEDLIIKREGGNIQVVQPEKLLDLLLENYVESPYQEVIRWKLPQRFDSPEFYNQMKDSFSCGIPLMVSGLSSTMKYAVMQRGEVLRLFSSEPEKIVEFLPGKEDERFPNLLIARNFNLIDYFDIRGENGVLWASPIQCYFELSSGDKRDKEISEQVKQKILPVL